MEEYLVYILPPAFAIIGFVTRFIWEFFINRRKRELSEKIKLIEFRLKEFYYPIFFYLNREQIIWNKIINLHSENTIIRKPAVIVSDKKSITYASIDKTTDTGNILSEKEKINETNKHFDIIKALDEENLKIHKEVQDIIHEKICIALPPKYLIQLLLQYDEHVTVYQILRKMNIYDRFPIQYGAPYPINIMEYIEKRIEELNNLHIKYSKKLG